VATRSKSNPEKSEMKAYTLSHKLNARQKLWLQHYCDCLDQTEASRRAGYSPKSAGHIGFENSIKLEKFIDKELEKRAKEGKFMRTRYTKEERLNLLHKDLDSSDSHVRLTAQRLLQTIERDQENLNQRRKEASQTAGGSMTITFHCLVVKSDGTVKD